VRFGVRACASAVDRLIGLLGGQADSKASGHAGMEAGRQAGTPTCNRASRQQGERTCRHGGRQAGKHADVQSGKQTRGKEGMREGERGVRTAKTLLEFENVPALQSEHVLSVLVVPLELMNVPEPHVFHTLQKLNVWLGSPRN
jgi:hypothetical protein